MIVEDNVNVRDKEDNVRDNVRDKEKMIDIHQNQNLIKLNLNLVEEIK